MNSAGYSKGFEEKNGKCERKGRLTILKLQGHGGIMHFGNSKDQVGGGGNKIWKLDRNTSKNAIAFYIINIHQMNLKILTGQASKHVNHSLNSLIQLVKINITLFQ